MRINSIKVLANDIMFLERMGPRLFCENRTSSFWLALATAFAGVSLWSWDCALDPQRAFETIWWRVAILPMTLPYLLALLYSQCRWVALACAIATFVACEAGFLVITQHLARGNVFSVAGFMYFVFMPLIVARGFTIVPLLVLLAVITGAPPIMAAVAGIQAFETLIYLATLVPASVLCLLAGSAAIATQRSNAEYRERLERDATTDPLTGLGNRRLFQMEVEARMKQDVDIGLLTIDLDRFKVVNDTYGHAMGDRLLEELGRLLKSVFEPEHRAFRIGGDEFAILLRAGTSLETANALAQQLACVLPREIDLGGVRVAPSASIGVAVNRSSIDQLLVMADAAMYEAKRRGGGTSILAA